MPVVVSTIAPIFLVIVTGFCLRRTRLFPAEAWPPIERVTYYVLFPTLLFVSLATAKLDGLPVGEMVVCVMATPLLMTLALVAARRLMPIDGPGFTSVVQGAVRFNTYLGIPVALAFYGQDTMALAALFIAGMVPFINVLTVVILTRYGSAQASVGGIAREICRNPLIVGCAAGIVLNATGIGLAPALEDLARLLGRAAPAVGLLCVGAGFDLMAARAGRLWVALTAALKLAAMPLLALGLGTALGVEGLALTILVLFHALPSAPSAYIIARQLGGDAQLIAGILTTQTALAAITLPLWIAAL